METLHELQQRLLRDPFDAEARSLYAEKLEEAGRWADALEQWQLAIRQDSTRSGSHLAAAHCCLKLGDSNQIAQLVEGAAGCADHDPNDPRLETLRPPEVSAEPERIRLRAVKGGRLPPEAGDVLSISSTSTVRFADIVGMEALKKVVRLRIIEPFLRPGLFQRFKRRSGGGVLLYGPPGCGKTMLARAVATECKANFTPVGISDILNLWIGESERNLAAIFEKARDERPSVLFFDELDALAFSRNKARSDHTRTIVNEFLTQLDGMSGNNEKVLILAATNMPWDVDEAMKRPGRFDRQIFVPPPDAEARAEMLRVKLGDVPCDPIDAAALAHVCKHFSGADMDGLIERAKDQVLGEILDGEAERNLADEDFRAVVDEIAPTTVDWLKTARNLVKFGGAGGSYKEVEAYLRAAKLY